LYTIAGSGVKDEMLCLRALLWSSLVSSGYITC
jgi:hypothetical protein